MAFTVLDVNGLLPGEPFTSAKALAFYQNVAAAAAGEADAPVIAAGWHPYNLTEVGGTETGIIYDFSVDGAVASVESPDFEDGYEYAFAFDGVSSSTAPTEWRMSLYGDTDAAYFTDVSIMSGFTVATDTANGIIQVQYPRWSKRGHSVTSLSVGHRYRTDAGSGAIVDELYATFFDTTKQKISKARFRFDTGNIDSGTITMLRRREYFSG